VEEMRRRVARPVPRAAWIRTVAQLRLRASQELAIAFPETPKWYGSSVSKSLSSPDGGYSHSWIDLTGNSSTIRRAGYLWKHFEKKHFKLMDVFCNAEFLPRGRVARELCSVLWVKLGAWSTRRPT
jgi:hypothetical protein